MQHGAAVRPLVWSQNTLDSNLASATCPLRYVTRLPEPELLSCDVLVPAAQTHRLAGSIQL